MPYPPRANTIKDYALDDQQGDPVDGTALSVDFANLAETVNQIIGFLKAGFTADRRWRPLEASGQELKYNFRAEATDGQTYFPFDTDVTFDPVANKATVYTNGVKVDSDDVAATADGVTIPAQTAGTVVETHLFNGETDLRTDLASTLANLGASLIGIEDKLGLISADNVEDALAEIKVQLNQVAAGIGDIQGLIRSDGSVDFEANQSMGGNRLVSMAAGIDDDDAVTVQQLNALAAIYGDLGNIFLALSGGTMGGIIDMGGFNITDLADGSAAGDAVNKGQLDALETALAGVYLPLAGGSMAGEINSKAGDHAIRIRQAVDDDEPVRKDQVDDIIAESIASAEAASFIGGTGVLGSYPADPGCPAVTPPELGPGGVFDYKDLTLSEDPSIGHLTCLRCTGDLDFAGRTMQVSRDASYRPDVRNVRRGATATVNGNHDEGSGGVGGAGAGGDGGGNQTGVIEGIRREEEGLGVAHTVVPRRWLQWARDEFIAAGLYIEPGDEAPEDVTDLRILQHGGGCLKLLVDGDIYMEGATVDASGSAAFYEPTDYRLAGGGGGIIIICKGTIYCGAGALLRANGGDGSVPLDDGCGGGGGGYVGVVANRIEGTLNIEAIGGPGGLRPTYYRGNGGYVEIWRGSLETGDQDPSINVSQGAGGPVSGFTRDGLTLVTAVDAAKIPFAGGYI